MHEVYMSSESGSLWLQRNSSPILYSHVAEKQRRKYHCVPFRLGSEPSLLSAKHTSFWLHSDLSSAWTLLLNAEEKVNPVTRTSRYKRLILKRSYRLLTGQRYDARKHFSIASGKVGSARSYRVITYG